MKGGKEGYTSMAPISNKLRSKGIFRRAKRPQSQEDALLDFVRETCLLLMSGRRLLCLLELFCQAVSGTIAVLSWSVRSSLLDEAIVACMQLKRPQPGNLQRQKRGPP